MRATKLRLFILMLVCVGGSASAQLSDTFHWAASLHNQYRILTDITYSVANDHELKLDLYLPRHASGPVPTLVYFHGGGWVAGSKEGAQLVFLPYLEWGWAVVNVEYRLARVSLAPAAVEDCRRALRWVVDHAAGYGLDTTTIVLSGHSAGGHLCLITGMLPADAGFDRPPEWLTPSSNLPVAAIINWFGITDVEDLLSGKNKQMYAVNWLGTLPDPEGIARSVSPVQYIRSGLPPILTVHGDQDQLVPYEHAVRLHKGLDRVSVPNKLITVPGGRHGGFSAAEMKKIFDEIQAFLAANGITTSTSQSGK